MKDHNHISSNAKAKGQLDSLTVGPNGYEDLWECGDGQTLGAFRMKSYIKDSNFVRQNKMWLLVTGEKQKVSLLNTPNCICSVLTGFLFGFSAAVDP